MPRFYSTPLILILILVTLLGHVLLIPMTQHVVRPHSQYMWLLPHPELGNLLNDLGNGCMMNIRVSEMPSEFQSMQGFYIHNTTTYFLPRSYVSTTTQTFAESHEV